MSVYSEYQGRICFEDAKDKEDFERFLMQGGWVETYSFFPEGEKFWAGIDEPYKATKKCVYLSTGFQKGIDRAIRWALKYLNVDKKRTFFRSVCFDGGITLEEFKDGSSLVLDEEDVAKIIGGLPENVVYDRDDMGTGKIWFEDAEGKAVEWMMEAEPKEEKDLFV